jgi:large conductance mechanosensitive channel
VTLNYGLFANAILNFIIVALVLFILVRQINRLVATKDAPAPATPEDVLLLREIRDALKARG